MIKEQEAGLTTAQVCRKHALSPATFYKLKANYGGLEVVVVVIDQAVVISPVSGPMISVAWFCPALAAERRRLVDCFRR
jgi:hypothetical protein